MGNTDDDSNNTVGHVPGLLKEVWEIVQGKKSQ
jgi:hypothetical protein